MPGNFAAPTPQLAATLQEAFDHLNVRLFATQRGGTLPDVVMLLARKAKAAGYFIPNRWHGQGTNERRHELALNPDHIRRVAEDANAERQRDGIKMVLSTIAHEMCHLWQWERGMEKPSRPAYHNEEFARIMERCGLITSTDGTPSGARVGQRMTHRIVDGGTFDRAADDLLSRGFNFSLASFPMSAVRQGARQGVKQKYHCVACSLQVWGRPGVADLLHCGSPMLPGNRARRG